MEKHLRAAASHMLAVSAAAFMRRGESPAFDPAANGYKSRPPIRKRPSGSKLSRKAAEGKLGLGRHA